MTDMNFDVRIRAHNDAQEAFATARQQLTHLKQSADNVSTSLGRQTGAMRANAQAARAMEAAHRAAAFRQRMLAVQGLDVAQSLALGMPPMQVAIQQGGQLAGIYAGQGGVTGAFKEATQSILGFARAHPVVIAATVALTAATFGLRSEIAETSGVTVGFGDMFRAVMHETAALIQTVAAPAIASLGPAFDQMTRGILDAVKLVGNSIINTFEFALEMVKATWAGLPAALKDIALSSLNGVADLVNPALERLGMRPITFSNDASGAAANLAAAYGQAYGIFQNDRVGDALGAVTATAIEFAHSTNEAADSTQALSSAAYQVGEPLRLMSDSLRAANDNAQSWRQTFTGFFQDFSQQIQQGASVWDAFKTAGLNALNSILNKVMEMATNRLFMSLLDGNRGGGFLGGLFGGGGGGNLFGLGSSIPIYHSGTNFVPDTGPAILQRGEAVIPSSMNRQGRFGLAPAERASDTMDLNGPVQVIFNMPQGTDMEEFRRSEAQIATMVARSVARGRRNQ